MKNQTLLFVLLVAIVFTSCNIEKLLEKNNSQLSVINEKNDSLILSLKNINENSIKNNNLLQAPIVEKLNKVKTEDFYFGNIISEKIEEKKGNWVKVKLSEKIVLNNGQEIIKEKSAWYSFNAPEYVYLIPNSVVNISSEITTDGNNTDLLSLENYKLKPLATTTKIDVLDQKALDILLSQKSLNFDGLKFDSKRFDFSNFALGSFRGTYFNQSNLSNVNAKREMITNDNDFTDVRIEGGVNKDQLFSFWKFRDFIYFNSTLENVVFENCLFSCLSGNGMVSFNSTSLKNCRFNNTSDGYFQNIVYNKASFENCSFTDVKMYYAINFTTTYTNCNFRNCLWQAVSFNNTQVTPSRISGGTFSSLKIVSGDYSKIIIEGLGVVLPNFSKLEVLNSNFNKASITAWFTDGSTFYGGASSNYSQINFTTSIFENFTFGNSNQVSKLNLKYCNFSNCEFRSAVKFIKCDVSNCTWPSDMSQVTFVDCTGQPTP